MNILKLVRGETVVAVAGTENETERTSSARLLRMEPFAEKPDERENDGDAGWSSI